MSLLTPWKIAEITGGRFIGTQAQCDVSVAGAVRDNRDVLPENLFICIKGARVDGHDYANDAFDRGAACCLAEREIPDAKGPYVLVESTLVSLRVLAAYYRSLFDIPVIGITGSVGKTSAKELIAAVLGAKFNVHKTDMNLNNDIGVPLTLLSLKESHEVAVVEMGISDFGDMTRLAIMARPDIFVMTKIGYAHIDMLGDLQGVLKAKTETFPYMKPSGIAVMNGDDELLRGFDTGRKTYTFGLLEHNNYRGENVETQGVDSTTLDMVSAKGRFDVTISAYGSHLSALAPAATAVADLLGLSGDEVRRGFASYTSVDGRAKVSSHEGITLVDDCYNANPNSVKAALTSLSSLSGRRVAVLGDMLSLGQHSKQMHYDVGVFAAQCGIELLVCQGEQATFFCEGYKSAGGTSAEHFEHFEKLLESLPNMIKKGDAVLVKASRGMHFERLLPVFS
ncbi:MAG: UDP-N-acetylmuramoyl-tripeptide--D-alanyl-D-alanine ligase [Oscillospiraceae bacterium]|nr:UDP-N-acetylmuramoyl-tripeptide--D-alanyl-D-alanine ligase [Oscillospiraceae bacterium]MCL2278418.1 UDP-N-acetylmuramoyl-tripeptide--D-alanyl-D-alanine ligase [Oscillospiraceae bacterium]